MLDRRFIKKLVTLLLILVFSQKMGMGLYLHNWLHAANVHSANATPLTSDALQNACSCLNDFTAPFIETILPELPTPTTFEFVPVPAQQVSLPVVHKYFRSLRAPPALIA